MKQFGNRYRCVTLCLMVAGILFFLPEGFSQTIFTAWQSERAQADEAYNSGNFSRASELYGHIFQKQRSQEVNLRIARSYYFSREFNQAISWYEKFIDTYGALPAGDSYNIAESYSGTGRYDQAIKFYSQVLVQDPDNLLMARKVWRLQNIQYLYEDSLHYAVQELDVNSSASEIAPVLAVDELIFLSNRAQSSVFSDVRDANTQTSFYHVYHAQFLKDTLGAQTGQHDSPERYEPGVFSGFQSGGVCFFNNGKNMAYVQSATKPAANGRRTLQLFFAEKKNGAWQNTYSFPFNSAEYSITDPSIREDGNVLYFASDMKGGQGGKDLYRCEYVNGKWSRPANLSDLNTPYDEAYPFIHGGKVLYFTSSGHAGIGGRDIFKTEIKGNGFTDVTNLGYPINTFYDDFSFVVDSAGMVGYFSSNRKPGQKQDDVYRVDIDMQSYPLAIEGVIRYKEMGWKDSTEVKVLPNAKLILIDNLKNAPVYETLSDGEGNFVLQIPYFSQYKIKVIEGNSNESVVSLEVPRHRKKEEKHDIVVVREVFKTNQDTR